MKQIQNFLKANFGKVECALFGLILSVMLSLAAVELTSCTSVKGQTKPNTHIYYKLGVNDTLGICSFDVKPFVKNKRYYALYKGNKKIIDICGAVEISKDVYEKIRFANKNDIPMALILINTFGNIDICLN